MAIHFVGLAADGLTGRWVSQEMGLARMRIAIVASVRLYCELLRDALARRSDCEVVGLFTQADFASTVQALRPDILLCDVSGPSAISVAREIIRTAVTTGTPAIGIPELETAIIARGESGPMTAQFKQGYLDNMVFVMRCAMHRELPDSTYLAASLFPRFPFLSTASELPDVSANLTSREQEILTHISEGCSNKEIARRLGIELATVKNHVHNLLEKMSVHTRGEAAARVRGSGWTAIAPHSA